MCDSNIVIYIVDDDAQVLNSTRALIEAEGWGARCMASASEFLRSYEEEHLGCLVLDLQLPEMSGLELQQQMTERSIDVPVVFITGQASIETSVKALKAGAVDFLEKPFTRTALVSTINNALALQSQSRQEKDALNRVQNRFKDLTDREWEVVNAIVSGPAILSSKKVARVLGISHRTVEHHRASIMTKTRCGSLPELIRLASFIGIADPSLIVDD